MNKQKVAVLGCGLWGRNIVRNFYNLEVLHSVCDLDEENLNKVREQYKGVNTTNNFDDILNNDDITAVAVVTPSHTHFNMVKKVLEHGKHVYVEKPISTSAKEAEDLKDWVNSLEKRGETDNKAGQLLKDLRHTQVLINRQLQSQRDLTHKIYDEHLLRKQKEETREARQKLMQTSFEASLERDMKAFKEAGEKVKLFFNEDFK